MVLHIIVGVCGTFCFWCNTQWPFLNKNTGLPSHLAFLTELTSFLFRLGICITLKYCEFTSSSAPRESEKEKRKHVLSLFFKKLCHAYAASRAWDLKYGAGKMQVRGKKVQCYTTLHTFFGKPEHAIVQRVTRLFTIKRPYFAQQYQRQTGLGLLKAPTDYGIDWQNSWVSVIISIRHG